MTAGSLALGGVAAFDYSYNPSTERRPGTLPPDAARLLAEIEADADDLNDLANAAAERVRFEKEELQRLRANVHALDGGDPKRVRGDRVYEGALKQVEAARERIVGLEARHAEHLMRWQSAGSLRTRIAAWMQDHQDLSLVAFDTSAPKLAKGERPATALLRVRASIAEMTAEASKVRRAKLTAAEAKDAARAFVAERAARARPDVSALFQGGSGPDFSDIPALFAQPVAMSQAGGIYQGGVVRDATCMVAWLAPDLLTKALFAEIDATADDKRAMTAEAKAGRLAELDVQLLAAEREEEALVRLALDEGMQVSRRADADPRAVLQIAIA